MMLSTPGVGKEHSLTTWVFFLQSMFCGRRETSEEQNKGKALFLWKVSPGQTGWLWSYLLQGCRSPCTLCLCASRAHSVWRCRSQPVSRNTFLGPAPREWATDPGRPLQGTTIAKTLTAFMV